MKGVLIFGFMVFLLSGVSSAFDPSVVYDDELVGDLSEVVFEDKATFFGDPGYILGDTDGKSFVTYGVYVYAVHGALTIYTPLFDSCVGAPVTITLKSGRQIDAYPEGISEWYEDWTNYGVRALDTLTSVELGDGFCVEVPASVDWYYPNGDGTYRDPVKYPRNGKGKTAKWVSLASLDDVEFEMSFPNVNECSDSDLGSFSSVRGVVVEDVRNSLGFDREDYHIDSCEQGGFSMTEYICLPGPRSPFYILNGYGYDTMEQNGDRIAIRMLSEGYCSYGAIDFDGQIASSAKWVKTDNYIKADYPYHPFFWINFDDTTTGNYFSSSEGEFDGVVGDEMYFTLGECYGDGCPEKNVQGMFENAVDFDGLNDYILFESNEGIDSYRSIREPSNDYAMYSVWVNVDDFENEWQTIFLLSDSRSDCEGSGCGNRKEGLFLRNDGSLQFVSTFDPRDGQIDCQTDPGVIQAGTWQSIFAEDVRSDSNTVREIYVDGELVKSCSYESGASYNLELGGKYLFFGGGTAGGAYFDGKIDESMAWKKGYLDKNHAEVLYRQFTEGIPADSLYSDGRKIYDFSFAGDLANDGDRYDLYWENEDGTGKNYFYCDGVGFDDQIVGEGVSGQGVSSKNCKIDVARDDIDFDIEEQASVSFWFNADEDFTDGEWMTLYRLNPSYADCNNGRSGDSLKYAPGCFDRVLGAYLHLPSDSVQFVSTPADRVPEGLDYSNYFSWDDYYGGDDVGQLECSTPPGSAIYGEWNHLVTVVDGKKGEMKIYLNGVLQNTCPYSVSKIGDFDGYLDFYVGNNGKLYDNLELKNFDELKIYGYALGDGDVESLYGLGDIGGGDGGIDDEGLVLYYEMESLGKGVVEDSSGNGFEGNADLNLVGRANGIVGKGYVFSDEQGSSPISVKDDVGLEGFDEISVGAWIRADKLPADMPGTYPMIASKEDYQRGTGYYFGVYNANTSRIGLRVGGVSGGGVAYAFSSPRRWVHVVGVYDGNEIRIYEDGELVAREVVGKIDLGDNDADLIVGKRWEGFMDDLRIYDRVLGADEIVNWYNSGESLEMHYIFDDKEQGSGVIPDHSFNKINGLSTGGHLGDGPSGFGKALWFDGVHYVDTMQDIDLKDDFSISGWFKLARLTSESGQNFQVIVDDEKVGSNYPSYQVFVSSGDKLVFLMRTSNAGGSDNSYSVASKDALVKNKWYHFGVVKRGPTLELYIDGALNSKVSGVVGDPYDSDVNLLVGARGGVDGEDNFLRGFIDDLRVYNRDLAAIEVSDLYQAF